MISESPQSHSSSDCWKKDTSYGELFATGAMKTVVDKNPDQFRAVFEGLNVQKASIGNFTLEIVVGTDGQSYTASATENTNCGTGVFSDSVD